MRYGTFFVLYRVSTKTSTPNLSLAGNVGKSPRKSEVHLVLVVHVGGNLKERSIACLLGSGTYLEGSGYSIANIQSPSESKMVLYWRKKSCEYI